MFALTAMRGIDLVVYEYDRRCRMKGLWEAGLTCSLLFASCEDLGTSYSGSLLGTFAYRAFDTQKVEVARGTLALFGSDSTVTGHWRFEDGRSGGLEGIARNGDIALDLNPGYIDNNLILRGAIARDTIAGIWEQIGFPGVMARGSFVAVRMR
jgi:hypothetical protein